MLRDEKISKYFVMGCSILSLKEKAGNANRTIFQSCCACNIHLLCVLLCLRLLYLLKFLLQYSPLIRNKCTWTYSLTRQIKKR